MASPKCEGSGAHLTIPPSYRDGPEVSETRCYGKVRCRVCNKMLRTIVNARLCEATVPPHRDTR